MRNVTRQPSLLSARAFRDVYVTREALAQHWWSAVGGEVPNALFAQALASNQDTIARPGIACRSCAGPLRMTVWQQNSGLLSQHFRALTLAYRASDTALRELVHAYAN